MAIPQGEVNWGNIFGSGYRQGQIGILLKRTHYDATNMYYHIEMWYRTRYAVSDESNTFSLYYTDGKGSSGYIFEPQKCSIHTYHNSGSGWSYDNCIKICSRDDSWGRWDYDRKITLLANFSGLEYGGGNGNAEFVFYVDRKPSYTISYNANGGSGAPSSQTKSYGTNIVLSSKQPTRTGHNFLYWNTNIYGGGSTYYPSSTYFENSDATMYAQWKIYTYTISYNANGGSGAPSSQTKSYGTNISISSKIPTREGYNFLGWGTSSTDTTIDYKSGATYSSNSSIILYAIWERKQFNIVLNAGNEGGLVEGKPTYIIKKRYEDTIGSLPIATKKNHKFIGWFKSNGQQVSSSEKVYNNITLYARFKLQENCYIKVDNKYTTGMMYIKINGKYEYCSIKVKDNDVYRDVNM